MKALSAAAASLSRVKTALSKAMPRARLVQLGQLYKISQFRHKALKTGRLVDPRRIRGESSTDGASQKASQKISSVKLHREAQMGCKKGVSPEADVADSRRSRGGCRGPPA
jgi:hypothetical protein